MQKFIMPLLVKILVFSLNPPRTTTVTEACINTHQTDTIHDKTMADAWISIRNKVRGRAPFNKGGRGSPRGGRNAVDPTDAHAATREGSPIASRLSTSLYINSTTDDTLVLFLYVTQKYLARHIITVRS
jgi:hypothetical protein